MFKCSKCDMMFDDKIRLGRHCKTHENKKPKKQKKGTPDFDAPRFDQVM